MTETELSSLDIILSLCYDQDRIGAVFYDLSCATLNFIPDMAEEGNRANLHQILQQTSPSKIILSSRTNEKIFEEIRRNTEQFSCTVDNPINLNEVTISVRPGEFDYNSACLRIYGIKLHNLSEDWSASEKKMYISSIINFEDTNMIRSAGALIGYLQSNLKISLGHPNGLQPVYAIKIFSLANCTFIDEDAFELLGIFSKKTHPSAFKAGTCFKESFGLFGLLNCCQSNVGRKKLRILMRQPTNDIETLSQRYDHIEFFSSNFALSSQIRSQLRYITSPINIFNRMKFSNPSHSDWSKLFFSMKSSSTINSICQQLPSNLTLCRDIVDCWCEESSTSNIDFSLDQLWKRLEQILDVSHDDVLNRNTNFIIRPNCSAFLDDLKTKYDQLSLIIKNASEDELSNLSSHISECNICYLPQVGFLLEIPYSIEGERYLSQLNDFEFKFSTDTHLNYKSPRTRMLDNAYGDIYFLIADSECEILSFLQQNILCNSQSLLKLTSLLAQLDCFLAFARVSREFKYTRPVISFPSDQPRLIIRAGRHPLFDSGDQPFVVNDAVVETQKPVHIITGTNSSGKTMYLKQIALIVYMASIGCFVPAEYMQFIPFDGIFVHMPSLQSNSVHLSQFMIALNTMARILQRCGGLSLVVIDEFGSETHSSTTLNLLAGLVNYLTTLTNCPVTFLTSHLSVTMFSRFSSSVVYKQMSSLLQNGQIVNLYKLADGVCVNSYSRDILNRFQIDDQIIGRFHRIAHMIQIDNRISPTVYTDDQDATKYNSIFDLFMRWDLHCGSIQELFDQIEVIANDVNY